jgi:hypothetical protein
MARKNNEADRSPQRAPNRGGVTMSWRVARYNCGGILVEIASKTRADSDFDCRRRRDGRVVDGGGLETDCADRQNSRISA